VLRRAVCDSFIMDEQRYMERQSDEEQYLESILAGSVLNEPFQPGIHDMLELSTLHNRASAAEQLSQDMHRQRSNTPPSNERAPYWELVHLRSRSYDTIHARRPYRTYPLCDPGAIVTIFLRSRY
jgi:hypothetical protein